MAKKVNKNSNRSYFIIIFVVIICFFVCAIGYRIYKQYTDKDDSALSRLIGQITYTDLDQVFYETTENYFLYVTYENYPHIIDFENELKEIIIEYNLSNSFYMLDVTSFIKDDGFIKELNNKLDLKSKYYFDDLPVIVYYHGGVFKEIVKPNNQGLIDSKDLIDVLNDYNITSEDQ